LIFLVEVGFDFIGRFNTLVRRAGHHTSLGLCGTCHRAEVVLHCTSGSTERLVPRSSGRVGAAVSRAASRAGVAMHYFGLDPTLLIPSSSNSFQKPQIHSNP
ncbi:hypothetical protein HAX54_028148, partial [Datura stramonium]|nr:hypothetical protein [Datura stramonium]